MVSKNFNILNYKILKNNILTKFNECKIEEVENELNMYRNSNIYDLEGILFEIKLDILKGKLYDAEIKLKKIYMKYEYNFEVNLALGEVYYKRKNYCDALKHFLLCNIIDSSREYEFQYMYKEILIEHISDNEEKYILENIINEISNSNNVYMLNNKYSYNIGENIEVLGKKYFNGLYDYYYYERDALFKDIAPELSNLFKIEVIPGKIHKYFKYKAEVDTVIPIMKIEEGSTIEIFINKEKYNFNSLLYNRFYYYKVKFGDEVLIKSNKNFIIGDIIKLKLNESKPKLILNIFIDGLSQKFIEKNKLEEIMPNTYKYFLDGAINNNCYSSGEWTYVSLASHFTGLSTVNHMVFHPNINTDNIKKLDLYTEIFKENGYNTAKIDGEWRCCPKVGYVKGMNRYVYQASIRGMHVNEVIDEAIEHIEAFKETNNFLWICIPDLHDIADEYETRLSTQIESDINVRVKNKTIGTSVRKKYDIGKIERYRIQLKRIDRYLKIIYDYINDNYKNDEVIVSIFSDHGQGYFIEDGKDMLEEERVKVPLMIKGKNISSGQYDEMIQAYDMYRIILNAIGIEDKFNNDANLPKYFAGNKERDYTISESIFPNETYKATINDKYYKFFFESEEKVTIDGRVKLRKYNIKLINKKNDEDETLKEIDIAEKYSNIIIEHIKSRIIF
ncbi:sulfatase-like hydrolase/transferase [Clostridium sp. 29_15]|uniref:sulfatase-like hydrolase/transferase n=1 Tax=Clostridium sp. 29_15 TaxID=1896982 RepID=UPI000969639E|nr:sulfatase-like hydrolase/transferase [Clostridium sp. 29_15]OKZ85345.1 MAG: hypothetical protein BHW04_09760 [Clostridium sp. 29_15]